MMLGQGLAVVSQALCFIGLARLLGVSEYGRYAGAVALVSIFSQYSTLGSGLLFLRYVSADTHNFSAYWGNILIATLSTGSLIIVGLSLGGPFLLGDKAVSLLIPIAIGDCICSQLTTAVGQVFQTFERMGITAVLNLATNVLRCVLACGMLFMLHSASAVQWAIASASVSFLAAVLAIVAVTTCFGIPHFRPELLLTRIREGIVFAVSGSTTSVYNDLDKGMLSHYGMNAQNGVYSMAYRVIDIATIPIRSIQSAVMPRFFREGVKGASATLQLASSLVRKTGMLGIAAAIGLCIAAPLLPLMAGKGFLQSVSALRWLCLIPVFRSFHLSAGDALTGAGLQRFRLATQFSAAILNFTLNLWLIPAYGWRGAAWASLATDGGLAAMNWTILHLLSDRQKNTLMPLAVSSQPDMAS